MRKVITTGPAVLTVGLLLVLGGWAPLKAQYLVSARAGLVNYTQGEVLHQTSSDTLVRRIAPRQQLDDGDAVLTTQGRAEILLNPGSILRLDRNTRAIFHRTDLPLVEFEIAAGTALIEATGLGREIVLRGKTPHATFRIKKSGLYRVEVRPDMTRLRVRNGEMELRHAGQIHKLKKGYEATVTPTDIASAKFLKPEPLDEFDQWAKDRAEVLIAANRSLTRRRDFGYGLMASLWVYDPLLGIFTFVPFGYDYTSPWGRRLVYRCPYPTIWYGGPYVGGGGGRDPVTPPPTNPERSKPSFRVGDINWGRGGTLTPGPSVGGRIEHRPMPVPSAPMGGEVRSAPGPVKAPHHQ